MDIRFDSQPAAGLTEEEVRRQAEVSLGRYSAEISALAVALTSVPRHPAAAGSGMTECRIEAILGGFERPCIQVSSRDRDVRNALSLALARCERTVARRFDVAKLMEGSR